MFLESQKEADKTITEYILIHLFQNVKTSTRNKLQHRKYKYTITELKLIDIINVQQGTERTYVPRTRVGKFRKGTENTTNR